MSVVSLFFNKEAKSLIMSGNSLEIKLRLTIGNNRMIDRVTTSLIVITFDIGQSAGKKPKSVR